MSNYDDGYGDNWGDDFLYTQAEYNGELDVKECDYCYRGLIHGERLYRSKRNGKVCVDCRDILRETDEEDE